MLSLDHSTVAQIVDLGQKHAAMNLPMTHRTIEVSPPVQTQTSENTFRRGVTLCGCRLAKHWLPCRHSCAPASVSSFLSAQQCAVASPRQLQLGLEQHFSAISSCLLVMLRDAVIHGQHSLLLLGA